MTHPFYAQGLKFSCTRCSACCRHASGFVYLSEQDLSRLIEACGMEYNQFISAYCRWVPGDWGKERLSLKEKSNFDCIFWDQGCKVYQARPLQCGAFPFWAQIVNSAGTWEIAASGCPGMGTGALHSGEVIEAFLAKRKAEPLIEKG